MNTSVSSANLTRDGNLYKSNSQTWDFGSHEADERSFDSELQQTSSLAFLPLFAVIVFVIGSLMKVYKWSRDSDRMKDRGDVEFGDEDEVNYGIINAGDKDFCQIDIRSDGASVYDTVNSFRHLANGYETNPYDTVTSYRSFKIQKTDGNHFDRSKPYKDFLHKITQNKLTAMEVKLQNDPNVEHCLDLEDEIRMCIPSARMTFTPSSQKQLDKDGQLLENIKKQRNRMSNGDVPTSKKKKIFLNTVSHTMTSGSLPSIHHTCSVSCDTEKDNRMNKKKLWTERKRTPYLSSGLAVYETLDFAFQLTNDDHCSSQITVHNQIKHFSEDNIPVMKRRINNSRKQNSKMVNTGNNVLDTLNVLAGTEGNLKCSQPMCVQIARASSKYHDNSHFTSDVVISGIHDKTVKKVPASLNDEHIFNKVFLGLDLDAELTSPSARMKNSILRTKILIAIAKQEFFKTSLNSKLSLKSHDMFIPYNSLKFPNKTKCGALLETVQPFVQVSSHSIHSKTVDVDLKHTADICYTQDSKNDHSVNCTELQQPYSDMKNDTVHDESDSAKASENVPSCQRLQRFYVTFVKSDIPSLKPD